LVNANPNIAEQRAEIEQFKNKFKISNIGGEPTVIPGDRPEMSDYNQ